MAQSLATTTQNDWLNSSALGTSLQQLLNADDIEPGSTPSYELCKVIYLYHPLGAKMTNGPVRKAMSQQRQIAIPNSPEERVRDQFLKQWDDDKADAVIENVMTQARVYGAATAALLIDGLATTAAADYMKLWNQSISFLVWDPLNTAGSIIGNQNPNAIDFQKHGDITVQGTSYHRGRTCTMMNEGPIYIAWTSSAYGYTGRSVYQRALFPLKTFVQTMVTDDLVSVKAGVLVATLKTIGSIADRIQTFALGVKRALIKIARVGGVISISDGEKIETLNMQNLEGPAQMARGNALKNVAMAAGQPAVMLEEETLTEGFGEGTEDAKVIAAYIDTVRKDMAPIYSWMTQIIQHRAWNPEFYALIQKDFPEEYAGVDYATAFYQWKNSFTAVWPNLLTEPESEKSKQDKVRQETIIGTFKALEPIMDPVNLATLVQWVCDNLNSQKTLFSNPLVLEVELITQNKEEQQQLALEAGLNAGGGEEGAEPKPPNAMGRGDAAARRRAESVPFLRKRDSEPPRDVSHVVRAIDAMTNGHARSDA